MSECKAAPVLKDWYHYEGETGVPVFHHVGQCEAELHVVNSVLRLASHVATNGTGEKTAAKGFLIIVGCSDKLLDGSLGNGGRRNIFAKEHIYIDEILEDDETMVDMLPFFTMDKAIIVCGKTGRILSNKWTVTDLSTGISTKGTKYQAASAIAQNGCFAIKCSQDACSCDGVGHGSFDVFPGRRESLQVAVKKSNYFGQLVLGMTGIYVSELKDFQEKHPGRYSKEKRQEVIETLTNIGEQCSYVQWLVKQGRPANRMPTVWISHSYDDSTDWNLMIDFLETTFGLDVPVFVDWACVNIFKADAGDWSDMDRCRRIIASCDDFVLWPGALSKLWCLFEVGWAIVNDVKIHYPKELIRKPRYESLKLVIEKEHKDLQLPPGELWNRARATDPKDASYIRMVANKKFGGAERLASDIQKACSGSQEMLPAWGWSDVFSHVYPLPSKARSEEAINDSPFRRASTLGELGEQEMQSQSQLFRHSSQPTSSRDNSSSSFGPAPL